MKPVSILVALLLAACGGGETDEAGSDAGRASDAGTKNETATAWVSAFDGDAERGARVYETCASCHALTENPQEPYFGPHLAEIFGRPIAADPNYAYSAALQQLEGTWTRDRLAEYLLAPRSFAPGTTMVQALPDSQKVADVLAYMRSVQASVESDAGR